ncbi:MAG: translation initiation factor IF-2 [Candidatus Pacebacteria bacterium]|nr:translation initiation factor IF-2 [Candidatus Paceibacterota bacterium]
MVKKTQKKQITNRAPIVAIMGHIDHGKSTLLDYIRKENTVNGETGGITQHIAAYETEHKGKKITFIDTPGHEAFAAARSRGANIADIAILVVAADDGVSAQTISALKFIKNSGIPFIVAINKIDKSNADIEKTKNSLLKNEVYLEGMGGDISYVEISALNGTGINDLLETIILTSQLENLDIDISEKGSGFVLESKLNSKKGISSTLIIKKGSLETGQYIVSGFSSSPIRIMEDFRGKKIKEACASMPVNIIGFDILPQAGDTFAVFENKKEAFTYINELKSLQNAKEVNEKITDKRFIKNKKNVLPLVIKTDVMGSLDAIKYELSKLDDERTEYKIIYEGCGDINESAIKAIGGVANATIIGFHVNIEKNAQLLADNLSITIKNFDIIYNLIEFLEKRMKELTPKEKFEEIAGEAKILKVFSWSSRGGVLGGQVTSGEIKKKNFLKIFRRGEEIGKANIKELQTGKQDVETVKEENQFGLNVTSKLEIVEGDIIQSIEIIER